MTSAITLRSDYVLATGAAAARRLQVLHDIYSPAGRRVLLQAGLRKGMRVADFGCGTGTVTRMLAEMIGPSGRVTGIDLHRPQIEHAAQVCRQAGLSNVAFVAADACATGLPRESFDLVYTRFLLLHLPDPAACLKEMRELLRPGGVLVIEDGDLATAESYPPTALNAFADLFMGLGPKRGVNYSIANELFHLVKAAGFRHPEIEIHQPAMACGGTGLLLKWSVEEAGPSFVGEGLITEEELAGTLAAMQAAHENPHVLALAPRMSLVWATKPA